MRLSVVVPVYNDKDRLRQCLQALLKSSRRPDEIIVVDDASTDGSGDVAREFGVILETIIGQSHGAASARNAGARRATGELLLSFDADVEVGEDTVQQLESYLLNNPDVTGVFGSYDERPAARNVVSLYKNLLNHHVHQHASHEACTFWTACGAIRMSAFRELGGFEPGRLKIEDLEFGMRLRKNGYKIVACPEIQVKHLKVWTLKGMIQSDIFDRAVPWTKIILDSESLPNDLNVDNKSRISAILMWGIVHCLYFTFVRFEFFILLCVFIIFFLRLNYPLYALYYRCGGSKLLVPATMLHMLYYLYSSVVFVLVVGQSILSRAREFFLQKVSKRTPLKS